MKVELHDERTFSSAAAMRAHYAAVRARLHRPAPPLKPPRQSDQARPISDRELAKIARHKRVTAVVAELAAAKDDAERAIMLSAAHFGVEVADILRGTQTRTIVDARFVAAFLMCEIFRTLSIRTTHGLGWSWVAPRLNRNHKSIMHAVRRVENSPRLSEEARKVRNVLIGNLRDDGVHYVQGSHYLRVDPEAYALKRTRAGLYVQAD